jgi:hypothetical protein
MSFDIVTVSIITLLFAQAAILLFGALRGFEIARSLVGSLYRSRAFWFPVLMILIVVNDVFTNLPFPPGLLGGVGYLVVPFVLVLVMVRVAGGAIEVALQTDFFHRDTLRWGTFRKFVYGAMAASVLLIVGAVAVIEVSYSNAPYSSVPEDLQLGIIQFTIVFVAVFSYEAVALLVASLRTSDKTFRSHVRLLGMALAFVIVANLVDSPSTGFDVYALADYAISLVATYLLYRAVMSLSIVGKVEKVDRAGARPL